VNCCPACGLNLDKRARVAKRDELLRELRVRHYGRLTVNAAADRIDREARTYLAGADYRLAKETGAILPSQRAKPSAIFFELAALHVEIPTARQLRRIL
jgi:hypothetical protein